VLFDAKIFGLSFRRSRESGESRNP